MTPSGRFSLVVEDRFGTFADEYSFRSGSLVVGRSRECDIVLPSDNVSRRHARLTLDSRGLVVEDLASANGIRVNGTPVEGAAVVKDGDVLTVGDYRLHVRGRPLTTGVRSVFLTLHGLDRGVAGRVFEIANRTTRVGRDADCGLVLEDESVSRIHARITVRPDGTTVVEDTDATNGVFVNDRPVRVWQLDDGDRVRFGDVSFQVALPAGFDAEDRPTARVVELDRPRRVFGPVFVAVLVGGALFGGAVLWDRHRDGPDPPVGAAVVAAPAGVADPAIERPGPDGPGTEGLLFMSLEALEGRRLDEAAAALDRVLAREPSNEEAVRLSRRIARERDALAALEAGEEAATVGRLEPAVAYLVQVPAASVFAAPAAEALRRLLPVVDARERTACTGGSRRSISCVQARALHERVKQALPP